MKDLTKIYIDLSKCTEEEQRVIRMTLYKNREYVPFFTNLFEIDRYYKLHCDNGDWLCGDVMFNEKTEILFPEFIKLFEGGDEARTELLPDVAYWRHRCLLAEKCLSVSPCDPDITDEQIKAHKDYNQYLETFGNKD